MNDVELGWFEEKELSYERRSIEAVQRIYVKGSNKRYRSEAVQMGKAKQGGLVWDIIDRRDNNEENENNLKNENGTDVYGNLNENENEVDRGAYGTAIRNSKTRTEGRESKYQIDGRVVNTRSSSMHDSNIRENKIGNPIDVPSSQKATHSYKARQMASQAIIKANAQKVTAARQKDMTEKKSFVLTPELEEEAERIKQIKQDRNKRTIFKLNRPNRKHSPLRENTSKINTSKLELNVIPREQFIDNAIKVSNK